MVQHPFWKIFSKLAHIKNFLLSLEKLAHVDSIDKENTNGNE
jgi:hypothetical protein